ncbi:pancreatic secretory granule membrane major glycoprotein GP2-like isoform X2 [Pyxicephalus adspersus]
MKTFLGLSILFYVLISVSADCGKTCASDEICITNSTNCECNSTSYTKTGDYPFPTIDCNGGNMNIFLSKCWLEINGYNTSNIRLQDPTCLATREIVNDTAQMVFHQPLINKYCDNTIELNDTHVKYGNTLYIFSKQGLITQQNIAMNVSCIFSLTLSVQMNITLRPILG